MSPFNVILFSHPNLLVIHFSDSVDESNGAEPFLRITQADIDSPGYCRGDGRCPVRALAYQSGMDSIDYLGITYRLPEGGDVRVDDDKETIMFLNALSLQCASTQQEFLNSEEGSGYPDRDTTWLDLMNGQATPYDDAIMQPNLPVNMWPDEQFLHGFALNFGVGIDVVTHSRVPGTPNVNTQIRPYQQPVFRTISISHHVEITKVLHQGKSISREVGVHYDLVAQFDPITDGRQVNIDTKGSVGMCFEYFVNLSVRANIYSYLTIILNNTIRFSRSHETAAG